MKLAPLGLSIALLAGAGVASAATGFTDPTMDPSNYTTYTFASGTPVDVTVSSIATGNPGSALEVHWGNDGSAVDMLSYVGLVYDGYSYDPTASGALASVDFSSDRYVDIGAFFNPTLNTVSRALIEQDGHFYVASIADQQLRQTWFTTAASGLTADQFSGFDFSTGLGDGSHPDFSAGAATLYFGFLSRLTIGTGGAPFTLDANYSFDNVSFAVNVAPVPEPASSALLLMALPVVGWAVRRRRGLSATA